MSSKPWKSADDLKRERQEARKAEIDSAFDTIAEGQLSTDELLCGLVEGFYHLCKKSGNAGQEAWEVMLIGPHNKARTLPTGARVTTPGTYAALTQEGSKFGEAYADFLARRLALAEFIAWAERRVREKTQRKKKEAEKDVNKALGLHEGPGK